MRHDHPLDAALLRFPHDQERLVRCHVAGRQRQIVLRDDREHFEHLGQELSVARHDDGRAAGLAVPDFVSDFRLGVVGRHPDDASEVADDVGHVPHRLRIHSADRGVERHRAEHFEPRRRVLARQVRESGRLRPVILENHAAHAALLRQLRDLEAVPRARIAVGIAVRVQIDGADERGIGQMLVDGGRIFPVLVRFPGRLRTKRDASRPQPDGHSHHRSEHHHEPLLSCRHRSPRSRGERGDVMQHQRRDRRDRREEYF